MFYRHDCSIPSFPAQVRIYDTITKTTFPNHWPCVLIPLTHACVSISLLSIAGKILAKIILNRLNAHLDQAGLIPESQCWFRKDRVTIAMIFTARQLQEKCQEQNVDLYMTLST